MQTTSVQLTEVKTVETRQKLYQRLLGIGDLLIVADVQQPYLVKNVKSPDRLARRIMKQAADNNKALRGSNAPLRVHFAGYAR